MHIVKVAALSFQPVDPANPTMPTGDPEKVTQGHRVPDYVAPFIINALLSSGVIVAVADDDPRFAKPAPEPAPALPSPDQPPTPDGLPPLFDLSGDPGKVPTADGEGGPERPAANAKRETWESYVVAKGYLTQGEAEAAPNKDALIAAADEHENV